MELISKVSYEQSDERISVTILPVVGSKNPDLECFQAV